MMTVKNTGLLMTALLLAQFANVATARTTADELNNDTQISASTHMPRGSSVGEPETLEMILFEDDNFGFETIEDSAPANEDISKWSERKIFRHYQQEIDQTNFWLDQVRKSPQEIARLNHDVEIAKRSVRRRGPRMSGLTCMAIAIQGEAGGEPAAGKAAVAQTIMTRAGGNPARICSVVFARAQFEAMAKRARQPSAETMKVAQAAIRRGKKCGFDHFINKRLQRSLGRRIPSWVFTFERRGCLHRRIGLQDYYSSCNCRH